MRNVRYIERLILSRKLAQSLRVWDEDPFAGLPIGDGVAGHGSGGGRGAIFT